MIWPQDENEFASAVLRVVYTETVEGQERQQVKIFQLNGFTQKEWLAGNRYSYELVFTDKEITLTCEVIPWRKKDITLDYTEVVVVSDKIQWHDNTIDYLEEHTGEVVLFNNINKPAECYFKIDAPKGARWTATLIPVAGTNTDAFEFVDPDKYDETEPNNTTKDRYTPLVDAEGKPKNPSGNVGDGSIARLKIRVKDATTATETNKAKLRIVVTTSNYEQSIVVENLCSGHDYNEYTLVQNMIVGG